MSVPTSEFYFDEVLRPDATQADVYEAAVAPVVQDVMRGYNGTVMAYGQTGMLPSQSASHSDGISSGCFLQIVQNRFRYEAALYALLCLV
jgi:hypothetical protein